MIVLVIMHRIVSTFVGSFYNVVQLSLERPRGSGLGDHMAFVRRVSSSRESRRDGCLLLRRGLLDRRLGFCCFESLGVRCASRWVPLEVTGFRALSQLFETCRGLVWRCRLLLRLV